MLYYLWGCWIDRIEDREEEEEEFEVDYADMHWILNYLNSSCASRKTRHNSVYPVQIAGRPDLTAHIES